MTKVEAGRLAEARARRYSENCMTPLRSAAAEKIAAMETEKFFAERRARSDDAAFLRILNREGGEPPRPEDGMN